jgi:hypothetical protein
MWLIKPTICSTPLLEQGLAKSSAAGLTLANSQPISRSIQLWGVVLDHLAKIFSVF